MLLLRDHGYKCDHAEAYFAADRRRVRIEIDEPLIATTTAAIARARELAASERLPPPLVDSPKCNGCSLVGICLPDEVRALHGLVTGEPSPDESGRAAPPSAQPWLEVPTPDAPSLIDDADVELTAATPPDSLDLAGPTSEPEPVRETRRLHPARDDRVPFYVHTQGAYLSLDGEELVAKSRDGVTRARLPNLSQVSLYGNIQVTTPALRTLLERGIPLSFFTYGGWFIGRAVGLDSKNVDLRLRQYRAASQPEFCLRMARGFVLSKS